MSEKKTERKHLPMIVSGNSDRPETKNLLLTKTTTTRSVVETTNNCDVVIVPGNRDNWSNRIVYLLSIIGFVVDLGRFFSSIEELHFFLQAIFGVFQQLAIEMEVVPFSYLISLFYSWSVFPVSSSVMSYSIILNFSLRYVHGISYWSISSSRLHHHLG